MDLMLSLMDEGFHLGCAVAALMVITQSVYMGLTSVDQVTSVIQKCLLLHFHMVRLRPGSGVLLEIAVWVLDMAFHLWFLLVDCTRVMSSLYFSNKPMQILHCVLLFIFHLQILRRYCMGIHVTVENVVNPAEDAIDEVAVAEPAPVAPPVMLAGHGGTEVGGGGHEYEDSSIQGSQTLQDTSTSTSKLTSTVNESFLRIPKPAPAGAWESCSCQRSASRDELSLGLGRPVDDSDGSAPACRHYGPRGERPSDGVSKLPSEWNVSLPGLCTEIGISDQATLKSVGKSAEADESTLKSTCSDINAKQRDGTKGLSHLCQGVVLACTDEGSGGLRLVPSEGDFCGAEKALPLLCEVSEGALKGSLVDHSLSCTESSKPIPDNSEGGELFLSQEHAEPIVSVMEKASNRQTIRPPSPENVFTSAEGGALSLSLVPSDSWSILENAVERHPSQLAAPSLVEAKIDEKKTDRSSSLNQMPGKVSSENFARRSTGVNVVRMDGVVGLSERVPWDNTPTIVVPISEEPLASRETSPIVVDEDRK